MELCPLTSWFIALCVDRLTGNAICKHRNEWLREIERKRGVGRDRGGVTGQENRKIEREREGERETDRQRG